MSMSKVEMNILSLLKKFDKPGPRYTSYPTAPLFSSSFGRKEYEEEIVRTNAAERGSNLSLYFHFPFCDTLCYFCGCTTIVTNNQSRIADYLLRLKAEIDLLSSRIAPGRQVVQMHWGGGTPTYLTPEQISDIAEYIQKRFTFSDSPEISVEIDPRGLTFEHLQALRNSGFNRVSLGLQDFNGDVQRAINRNQSEEMTRQAIAFSRQLGFSSLNLDLIYGLPYQTPESFSATLDKVIDIHPNRIAAYNFAYVPWIKPHQKLIHEDDLPTPEMKLRILTLIIERLVEAGYVYIGMDHFATADDELTIAQRQHTLYRNFQGYSTNAGCDLFGLGMSAISHIGSVYAQNAKHIEDYESAVDAGMLPTEVGYHMSADDQLRKYVIMRLMCDLVLNTEEVERRFQIDFNQYFETSLTQLKPLLDDGLLLHQGASYTVTMNGRLFLRNIAMCFDAHLPGFQKQKPLFSRTV